MILLKNIFDDYLDIFSTGMSPDGRDPHGGGGDDVGGSAEGSPVHHEAALDLRVAVGESCRYHIYSGHV